MSIKKDPEYLIALQGFSKKEKIGYLFKIAVQNKKNVEKKIMQTNSNLVEKTDVFSFFFFLSPT